MYVRAPHTRIDLLLFLYVSDSRSNYTTADFSGPIRHAQESYSNSTVHNGWLPPHASLPSRSHTWATWCRSTSTAQWPSKQFKINSSTRQATRAIKRAAKRADRTTRSDRLPRHNDRRVERRYNDRDCCHDDMPESSRSGKFHRHRPDVMSKDKYLLYMNI